MSSLKKKLSVILASMMIPGILAGCADKPPADYKWATYYSEEDTPFLPENIFSQQMYVTGFTTGNAQCGWVERTGSEDTGAFIFKGEYGKCYEVKVTAGAKRVLGVKFESDPARETTGKKLDYTKDDALYDKEDVTEEAAFMYTCRKPDEYLMVYTGSSDPIYIGERTILKDTDIADDNWWTASEKVGSIADDCTFGDIKWTSEEVLDNLYEPVRKRHRGYITREVIGKDQSGDYNIYAYKYEPENYETTVFLNSGTHGDEQVAYFALAKVMQLIADAKPEDTLLYTLRHKVRFIVVPILNVWSVSKVQSRANSKRVDLNRDFEKLTQQETKNLITYFDKYADETEILMDFHIAAKSKVSLYYNFINFTDNAVANYKTTNHMHHRYRELGYGLNDTDISKIPGSYKKSSSILEGRIWNSYGIPSITVEYVTSPGHGFPEATTSEAITAAVETQMNFIIQNSLYFIANP